MFIERCQRNPTPTLLRLASMLSNGNGTSETEECADGMRRLHSLTCIFRGDQNSLYITDMMII